jgi:NAD(P)-dependent dehydrogenase (short-subunit alcohol dehydrogenase family)
MNGSQDSVQSIFITGAASGIGRETARLFARRGWRVGAVDLDEAGVGALAGEIGAERCLAARLDVRDAAAWRQRIGAFAAWTGGRMDALFNCAGRRSTAARSTGCPEPSSSRCASSAA